MATTAGPHAAALNPPAHSSKAEGEKSSNFYPFAACKGSLRQQPEGCSAHALAARLGSSLATCCTAPALAGPGSVALDAAQHPQQEPDSSPRSISVKTTGKRKIPQCAKGEQAPAQCLDSSNQPGASQAPHQPGAAFSLAESMSPGTPLISAGAHNPAQSQSSSWAPNSVGNQG